MQQHMLVQSSQDQDLKGPSLVFLCSSLSHFFFPKYFYVVYTAPRQKDQPRATRANNHVSLTASNHLDSPRQSSVISTGAFWRKLLPLELLRHSLRHSLQDLVENQVVQSYPPNSSMVRFPIPKARMPLLPCDSKCDPGGGTFRLYGNESIFIPKVKRPNKV